MGKLDGKVGVVTGGNRGIGAAIGQAFAGEGCAVVLAARDPARLEQTAAEIEATGASVLAVPTDITDEAQVEALLARTMERFGRLDLLVNNAGAFDGGPLDELSLETRVPQHSRLRHRVGEKSAASDAQ
jgi:NAD(P)-dependent dehydrogenase (short-subunit alcohol dehydrogenase family)